tara:strand:+ start:58333 stop:58824 length:492 start_codon:yes stop_codon:yes gene_type:complete
MQRAEKRIPKGDWSGPAADTVVLTHHDRHRRRMRMLGMNGTVFVLDLTRATTLRDGDGLMLDDGRIIAVKAAAEPLLEITCDDPVHLARIAWHIGNRHLSAEISGGRILIAEDHVIGEMVKGLGANVRLVDEPFDPEGGAYGDGGGGHHHDDDDHDYAHGSHR